MKLRALFRILTSTVPSESREKEVGQTVWTAIFNSAVLHVDEKNQNKGIADNTLTKDLLVMKVKLEEIIKPPNA